ncbi:hypothetical protein GLE_2041 [Lysobacter enzymogenes]|uniref:Uncharacterized protein n=1 Tax=Lysobacter enzymogenes TaxID=69 RepID=A0A0S2DGK1_LYSEN|nr:hypothetical protein GLE_2041 [Lysobacter enzymogenes]
MAGGGSAVVARGFASQEAALASGLRRASPQSGRNVPCRPARRPLRSAGALCQCTGFVR